MSAEIDIQLKKLILDDDFTSIQSLVNEEINLMSILRIAHKELQHSNLLAWLFDPSETHKLGDFFIKEFIKLYYKENEYQDLGNTESKLSVFDFVNLEFNDLEIRREHKNIDILILSKSNGLCIMIENKVYAKEGYGQLTKYRNYIESEYSSFKYKIYIYLSLFEQDISESETEFYVQLTYQHIKKLVLQILNNQSISIARNTRFVLEQYLQTLKTLMNENEEIEKTARELYKRYKSAFDLVFKYASPSNANLVPHNLRNLIQNQPQIRSFHTNNSYVRFQPEFLYENIDKLKEKGFITEGDTLENNWLFLFEFHITSTFIFFDLKIGEYHDTDCRQRVFEFYKRNKEFFNRVIKKEGKLSPSWHLSFQKRIITTPEYNKFLESDHDNLDEIIEKRFGELMKKNLPTIQKIFEEELNNLS